MQTTMERSSLTLKATTLKRSATCLNSRNIEPKIG
jgi:hypothetical protein